VIYDLDNPFRGDWQVRPEPIRQILEQLKKEAAHHRGAVVKEVTRPES